jgi:predicted Ser/Thr protein kinase
MSNSNITLFGADTHPHLYLPADPFPYAFENEVLKPTLRDLLKVLRRHPAYVEPTHAAFYRLVIREGIDQSRSEELLRMTGKEIPAFVSCADFFGIEPAVYEFLNGYGYQASQGGRTRKKAAALTGSPGAGKSDLVNHFQYKIMRKREPAPFLAGSPMWSNPLNALFLVKLIAARKTKRRRGDMLKEITRIIDSLDLTGTSELDFANAESAAILAKHGLSGKTPSNEQLAQVVMANEKDFVALVCFGLGLPKVTLDALVQPDPWAQDVVLGEFFGAGLIDSQILEDAGVTNAVAAGKKKGDAGYGKFDPSLAVELADFPIDNMFMAEGQGLVDVAEVQPINFDLRVWRGDVDISSIGKYEDRDPRCVSPSGVFNRGKLIVLTEGFRNPPEGFRILLEGLEGQRLSLPEPLSAYFQQGVGWEGMIWLHSNDEQANKFWSNPDHRAHNDRLFFTSVPYPIEPKQAAKVTSKLWKGSAFSKPQSEGGCHLEPLVIPFTAMFRAASHLDWASKRNLPFMAVMRAYNHELLRQPGMGTEIDLRALREQAPWTEGLSGMSPREMDDILGQLAANAKQEHDRGIRVAPCVTVAEVRDTMIERFRTDPRMNKKTRDIWTEWLQSPLEREYRRRELTKIYKAAFIPNFRDLCTAFKRKYLECLRGIHRNVPKRGYGGGDYLNAQQMEQYLQEIERADALSINSAQADKFRANVLVAETAWCERHNVSEAPYDAHEGLKRCIEAYVLRQAKDITGVTGLTNLSEEEQKKLDSAKAALIAQHGYCNHCGQKLLLEVAMTRDFLVA